MMKACFIINPCSGRNRRRPWLPQVIREFVAVSGIEGRIVVTEGRRHATVLARAAADAGCEVVAAVGGDGTMNEVAQGLLGTPTALAIIPCGSGNGLALHLGIPRTLSGALALVGGDGRQVSIDTGTANGRPFFNAMGAGFDAEVSRRFNQLSKRGLSAYARTGFSALRALRPERIVIGLEGRRTPLDVLLVTVANSDQYGNNARIAPGASVTDGRLDLVAVKPAGLLRLAWLLPRLFLGRVDRSPHIVRMAGRAFEIERAAGGIIHTDGETHAGGTSVNVRVEPLSLRVLVPDHSRVTSRMADLPARVALHLS